MTTATQTTVINGVRTEELFKTMDAIREAPAIAKFNFKLQNKWEGGGQNRSTVQDFYGALGDIRRDKAFVMYADEPPLLLGKDSAPNPVEHLLHALTSCVTTSVVYHSAARGIEIQALESSVEGDLDLQGFLGLDETVRPGYQAIRINFRIKADVPDSQIQEIVKLSRFSPVYDTVSKSTKVEITGERL